MPALLFQEVAHSHAGLARAYDDDVKAHVRFVICGCWL
jgi:hypothetical protein